VHGVPLGTGQLADVVGGKRERVAIPLGGEGLAVRRKSAANAVWIRNEEGRAKTVAEVAKGIVVGVQHLFAPASPGVVSTCTSPLPGSWP